MNVAEVSHLKKMYQVLRNEVIKERCKVGRSLDKRSERTV